MRGSPSRAINRGSLTFTRPVFPSPTPPGWNQRRFGAPPELRTPPSPAAHVRGGDRPSSTDLELPLNSHPSISNPVVHSMRATSRRTANSRCDEPHSSRPVSCHRMHVRPVRLRGCCCPKGAAWRGRVRWLLRNAWSSPSTSATCCRCSSLREATGPVGSGAIRMYGSHRSGESILVEGRVIERYFRKRNEEKLAYTSGSSRARRTHKPRPEEIPSARAARRAGSESR